MPPRKEVQEKAKVRSMCDHCCWHSKIIFLRLQKYEELQGDIFSYCQSNNLHVLNTDMMHKAFLSNEINPTMFMARYLLNENNKSVPEFQQEEIARLSGLLAMSKKREEEQLKENEELRRRFKALERQHNRPIMNPVRVQTFKNDTPMHMIHSAVALSTSAPQSYELRQPGTSTEKPVVTKRRTNSPAAPNGESSQISKRQRLSLPKSNKTLSETSSSDSSSSEDDEKRAATSEIKAVEVPPSIENVVMIALKDSSSSDDEVKIVDGLPSTGSSALSDSSCKAVKDKPAHTSNPNSVEGPPSVRKSVLEEIIDSLSSSADNNPVETKSVDVDNAIQKKWQEEAFNEEPQASSHIKRANGDFKDLSTYDDFELDYEYEEE